MKKKRTATIDRKTAETAISPEADDRRLRAATESLPGSGSSITCSIYSRATEPSISTSTAGADLDVDQHHTVEDVGIALGEAFEQSARRQARILRAGYFLMTMDETLGLAAVDLSGRASHVVETKVRVRLVGDLQAELVEDFFEGIRAWRPRERPRENDVRPLEPPQDRGPLQKPSLALCASPARAIRS